MNASERSRMTRNETVTQRSGQRAVVGRPGKMPASRPQHRGAGSYRERPVYEHTFEFRQGADWLLHFGAARGVWGTVAPDLVVMRLTSTACRQRIFSDCDRASVICGLAQSGPCGGMTQLRCRER